MSGIVMKIWTYSVNVLYPVKNSCRPLLKFTATENLKKFSLRLKRNSKTQDYIKTEIINVVKCLL